MSSSPAGRTPCAATYRAPEHNARSFTGDGYFRTGTLARRTRDGHLVVIRKASDGGRFGG
ncbi:hypothetical protein ACFYNW_29855 [Streptomyces virginiae]|uniref:hypothetical protein n=1 Tax=Streptomyces virginiae TaxID=1961 RepID=UPI0036E2F265